MGTKTLDLTGRVFGHLSVKRRNGVSKERQAMWLCACDCGSETTVRGQDLRSGKTTSCKCKQYSKGKLEHLAERFWALVNKNGPVPTYCPQLGQCWEFKSIGKSNGYGRISCEGKELRAHRVSVFLETGEWPTLHVCHRCDNKVCVRYSHLFLGTDKDNMDDLKRKRLLQANENKALKNLLTWLLDVLISSNVSREPSGRPNERSEYLKTPSESVDHTREP